ncbi:hypothetical protein AGMMS50233_10760 [Endomicrobiia bacterium]|nr:hypothetical protein AGMMS50233_10760 [Endomicrobiia bacterium]
MVKITNDTSRYWYIKYYIDNGIKLICTYENGALIAGGDNEDYKEALTSCLADIKALCLGKGDLRGGQIIFDIYGNTICLPLRG